MPFPLRRFWHSSLRMSTAAKSSLKTKIYTIKFILYVKPGKGSCSAFSFHFLAYVCNDFVFSR